MVVEPLAQFSPGCLKLTFNPLQIIGCDATGLARPAVHTDMAGGRPVLHVVFEFSFQILACNALKVRCIRIVFHACNDPSKLNVQSCGKPLRFPEQAGPQ